MGALFQIRSVVCVPSYDKSNMSFLTLSERSVWLLSLPAERVPGEQLIIEPQIYWSFKIGVCRVDLGEVNFPATLERMRLICRLEVSHLVGSGLFEGRSVGNPLYI